MVGHVVVLVCAVERKQIVEIQIPQAVMDSDIDVPRPCPCPCNVDDKMG